MDAPASGSGMQTRDTVCSVPAASTGTSQDRLRWQRYLDIGSGDYERHQCTVEQHRCQGSHKSRVEVIQLNESRQPTPGGRFSGFQKRLARRGCVRRHAVVKSARERTCLRVSYTHEVATAFWTSCRDAALVPAGPRRSYSVG